MDSPQLRATLSDGRELTIALDQAAISVGRSEDSGVHLDDLSVSRRHARILIEGGDAYVEDLGSSGGTFIGSRQLTPRTRYILDDGSHVRFGDVQAQYHRTTPEPAPEPEPDDVKYAYAPMDAAIATIMTPRSTRLLFVSLRFIPLLPPLAV